LVEEVTNTSSTIGKLHWASAVAIVELTSGFQPTMADGEAARMEMLGI
jgi:hypothetical protein